MNFDIVFKNLYQEELRLNYSVYTDDISLRWYDALKEQCKKDNKIYEPDRMYNFPNNEWTEEKLVSELNECITKINKNEKVIEHFAYVGMQQDRLNILHHYFEELRGGVLTPTNFWNDADEDVRYALERYNIIIHRAESFYHNRTLDANSPRIVCRFKDRIRYPLEDEDYEKFTLIRKFGEVYINYCEVGKPLYDVFKDGDDIVGEDNIRPLQYYSCDFNVSFHERSFRSAFLFLCKMDEWWDRNHNYLTSLGFNRDDPKNSIGNIPVAILTDKDIAKEEIIIKLSEYSFIDRIEINE